MYKNGSISQIKAPALRLEKIGRAFSIPSWWYTVRGLYLLSFVYRTSALTQFLFFEKNLADTHLEIPAGDGTVLAWCLRLRRWKKGPAPARIEAADISDGMLASARRRFARCPNIRVGYGDVGNLTYADNTFASVNIANGFHPKFGSCRK